MLYVRTGWQRMPHNHRQRAGGYGWLVLGAVVLGVAVAWAMIVLYVGIR